MLIATDAIVLKRIPFSDTSLICRLFTKENGKITIIAKGALNPKKTTSATLEPINHIHIQYYHKANRDIQLLKDAIFIKHYSNMRKSLNRTILALAAVEILDKSTQEENPNIILYKLIWRVLDKLNDLNVNELAVFAFYLYQFSLRIGYMPNISVCNQCDLIMDRGGINIRTGEIICKDCIFPENKNIINFSFLNKLKTLHLDQINILSFNKREILNSVSLLEIFLSCHIEGFNNIKSLKIIHNILNNKNIYKI